LWMNGTSESRWRRKTASVPASLSATRSRKRPGASGGSGATMRRSGSMGGSRGVVRLASEGLDGIEGDHLGEPAALEAIHLAALEEPPGDLVVIGVADALDLVGMPHLVVDPALVVARDAAHEAAHLLDVGGVLDGER